VSRLLRSTITATVAAFSMACGAEGGADATAGVLLRPRVVSIEGPGEIVLPGSRIEVTGDGFLGPPAGVTRVIVDGRQHGQAVRFAVETASADGRSTVLELTPEVVGLFVASFGPFEGTVQVEVHPAVGSPARSKPFPISFVLEERLGPRLSAVPPSQIHPGSHLRLSGEGFLLEGEGQTVALLDGSFLGTDGEVRRLSALPWPLGMVSRRQVVLRVGPDLFGVRPGHFTGSARLQNQHVLGAITESQDPIPLDLELGPPRLDEITPASARRGQVIVARGAGLLEPDPRRGVATLLLLDGVFSPVVGEEVDLTGPRAYIAFPDRVIEDSAAEVVLRVELGLDGQLQGLGTLRGIFRGLVSPWLLAGNDSVVGTAAPFELHILPPRQAVFIKTLPGFDEALQNFGLRAVREAILSHILVVNHRDYANLNITFTFERPTDFEDYSVIEVGGRDPNGVDLLGLDNTEGKDVGNLRFNDVIGGLNALSEAQGFYAYGGVFVHSFLQFSKSHPLGDPAMSSVRFDDIFAPVVPELGGSPAKVGDADPAARSGEVAEAVRVLANLIGNTVTHEIGHAIGLAAIEGRFHNEGDNPGWIMDAGPFRPFEERAEIDGQGPAVFSPTNRRYLDEILPPDP